MDCSGALTLVGDAASSAGWDDSGAVILPALKSSPNLSLYGWLYTCACSNSASADRNLVSQILFHHNKASSPSSQSCFREPCGLTMLQSHRARGRGIKQQVNAAGAHQVCSDSPCLLWEAQVTLVVVKVRQHPLKQLSERA